MALNWYKYEYFFLDLNILTNPNSKYYGGFKLFGAALPLILIIVFASIAILSTVYAF
jgi:hypothetical protein